MLKNELHMNAAPLTVAVSNATPSCPLCKAPMVKMTAILLPSIWRCKKCNYIEKCKS